MTATRQPVLGIDLDGATRCVHWHGPLDIVALKLACCRVYYGCRDCHDALAGHPAEVWPVAAWDQSAAMCGACGHQMSAAAYQACEDRCPACAAPFNPGCRRHRHLYFETFEAD